MPLPRPSSTRQLRPSLSRLPTTLLAALLMLSQGNAFARQSGKPARTPRTEQSEKSRAKRRGDEETARRVREQAVETLRETATEARKLEDLAYRARLQTLAADALWPADETQARAIFRRAWEAATDADHAARETPDGIESTDNASTNGASATNPANAQLSGSEAQLSSTGAQLSDASRQFSGAGARLSTVTEEREAVLSKVASRDAALAETFLRQMLAEARVEGESAEQATPRTREGWRGLSAGGEQRLQLVEELLERREYRRAAELAAPLVEEGASARLLTLLLHMRAVAPQEADALYLRLLGRTRADLAADANDVLLLSSYVVSPGMLLVFGGSGGLMLQAVGDAATRTSVTPSPVASSPVTSSPVASSPAGSPSTVVPQAVRRAFFKVAAGLLLRAPVATRGSGEAGGGASSQMVAAYFAIGRLLPFFEREASEYVPELQARRASLAGMIEPGRQSLLASQMELQSVKQANPVDTLRPQLERLGQARTREERERLRLGIVRTAARRRLWERARSVAAEIEDETMRRAALSFVAAHQVAALSEAYAEHEGDDFERAASFVRNADVPPFVRAWGFAQAARMALERGRRERASELLEEAVRFASSTQADTHERVAAYAYAVQSAARFDAARAWELLPSVVRAADGIEDLTGDEDSVELIFAPAATEDASRLDLTVSAAAFRLDEVFATMARVNFARALEAARSLKGGVPHAFASIAVARAALDVSKPATRDVRMRREKS